MIILTPSPFDFSMRIAMPIEIKIYDSKLAEEIIKSAPKGVSFDRSEMFVRSADAGSIVILTLKFVAGGAHDIFIGLLVAWLCKLSENKSCHINKGTKKIPESQDGVRRWIQEELNIGNDDKANQKENCQ